MKLASRSGILLLLLPTLLLAFILRTYPNGFYMDDTAYWLMAIQWKEHFEGNIFSWLWDLHHWQVGRPTFFSLYAYPFLWLTNFSITPANFMVAAFSSMLASGSLYAIFRSQKLSRGEAILGTLSLATIPYVLCMGRFFQTDYHLGAVCLLGLACLLRGKYLPFGILYCLALLIRPLEGILALPCFLFFLLGYGKKESPGATRKFTVAASLAILGCGLAFSRRTELFLPWIAKASLSGAAYGFPKLVPQQNLPLFLVNNLFWLLGITGLALSLYSFWRAWQIRRDGCAFLSHLGLAAMVIGILGLIAFFDNLATREAAWRYVSLFLFFFQISAVILVARARQKRIGLGLIAAFLAMNAYTYYSYASGRKILEESLGKSVAYQKFFLAVATQENGTKPLLNELARLLPPGRKTVLFAGRSRQLLESGSERFLRCAEMLQNSDCQVKIKPHYLVGVMIAQMEEGRIDLRHFGMDALVYIRNQTPGDFRDDGYPMENFVKALDKNIGRLKGIKLAGKIRSSAPGVWQELEVYVPDGPATAR